VEENVLFDPIQISPSSFIGILFQSQGIAGFIEKFFRYLAMCGNFLYDGRQDIFVPSRRIR
jgi:hypothetical protein